MKSKIVKRGKEIARRLRRHITPPFLLALALSLIFWYSGKLRHTYTAEIPVTVVIEGERHRATCVVEGTGHNIVSSRYFRRKRVKLRRSDVELIPVDGISNTYKVTSSSLQNAISVRNPSLKIVSVSQLPYISFDEE